MSPDIRTLLTTSAVALALSCQAAPHATAPQPSEPESTLPAVAPPPAPSAPDESSAPPEPPQMPKGPVSNPGQVWCGDKWCRAHVQTCCPSEQGTTCVPTASLENGWCKGPDDPQASCDETADCPDGLVCCGWEGSQGLSFYSCSEAPCGRAEACLTEDGCRPDFTCRRDTPDTLGECIYAKARVRCGKQMCSGAKPACRWRGESGECVASGEGTLGCTRDDECAPGYHCCYGYDSTYCAGACGSNSAPLCETKKDCPPRASLQPTGCEPAGYPSMRYCAY